jgi:hypothetical protein
MTTHRNVSAAGLANGSIQRNVSTASGDTAQFERENLWVPRNFGEGTRHRCPSVFAEEVLVQPFEFDDAVAAYATIVLNLQVGKFATIEEDHSLGQMSDIVPCRLAERRGRNKNALGGS